MSTFLPSSIYGNYGEFEAVNTKLFTENLSQWWCYDDNCGLGRGGEQPCAENI